MSPLNRGPLMGPRIPPASMRPPMPRYGRAPIPPGMTRGMPLLPMNPMFGPRGRPIPPPPRPGPIMARPGPHGPPMFGPRGRPMPHMPPMPPMGLRGHPGMRGPPMRPGPRGILPPHALPHMRPKFPPNHTNGKGKANNTKKANKLDELELKKPWMTDEIRSEIQKKNKLYAKAKKNKDAKEWEEFKDLRNKVTRMIRDAKNEYLAKNPEQAHLYENDEEIPEVTYEDIVEFFAMNSEDEEPINPYCEVCDRDFDSNDKLEKHIQEHQTCRIDGCSFTAHPKIVEKHISMQHSTGLYERMKNVMSDEDIAKWRAERKKRYPTAATVKLQQKERTEKEKRGEVIQNQVKGQNLRNIPKREQRKIRKRKRNKPVQTNNRENPIERKLYRGLMPFAGTALLDINEQSDDSSVEDVVEVEIEQKKEKVEIVVSDEDDEVVQTCQQPIPEKLEIIDPPKPCITANSMFSLVADYGSDSNDEQPEEVPIKKLKVIEEDTPQTPEPQLEPMKTTDSIQVPISTQINASTSKDDKTFVINNKKINAGEKHSNRRKRRNNSQYSNGRLRLLNNLLARSIQHERNAIFQCIKFIANNNFFD